MAFPDLLHWRASGSFRNIPMPPVRRADPGDYLLVWVIEGTIHGDLAGEPFTAGRGRVLMFPPSVPHSYAAPRTGDWHWLWVHFAGSAAAAVHEEFTAAGVPLALTDDQGMYRKFMAVLTHAQQSPAPQESRALSGELLGLLGTLLDRCAPQAQRSAGEPRLEALFGWIAENLNRPLPLSELCAVATYSPAQLHRLFIAAVGLSPQAYVARVRHSTAADLLALTSMAVADVAAAVGYADPLYFSRRFKAWSGLSPSAFRAGRIPGPGSGAHPGPPQDFN